MSAQRHRLGLTTKERLVLDLTNTLYGYSPYTGEKDSIREGLSLYSQELLAELAQHAEAECELTWHAKTGISKRYPEETMRELVTFLPFIPFFSHEFSMAIITSLRSYRQLPDAEYLHSMGQEVIRHCTALLKFTAAADISLTGLFRRENDFSSGIADDQLVNLIISHADEVERLIDIVRDRGTVDPVILSEVLASETPPLNQGIL